MSRIAEGSAWSRLVVTPHLPSGQTEAMRANVGAGGIEPAQFHLWIWLFANALFGVPYYKYLSLVLKVLYFYWQTPWSNVLMSWVGFYLIFLDSLQKVVALIIIININSKVNAERSENQAKRLVQHERLILAESFQHCSTWPDILPKFH